ncbi:DUF5615 family PIN-like protein [Candidatus Bipolaricaulota bacterium]|nr:DUF5615 family PIN-like protein [Candidatus Bipolaricaulota bacterium]
MVRFLADECTFDLTVEFLRSEGWDVTTVKEIGLRGAKDPEVLNKAREMGGCAYHTGHGLRRHQEVPAISLWGSYRIENDLPHI